jgi:uncharacterized membrane protein
MIQFNSQEEMDEFLRKVAEHEERIRSQYTPEQIENLRKQQEDAMNTAFWYEVKKNCMYFGFFILGTELLKWYLSSNNSKKSK